MHKPFVLTRVARAAALALSAAASTGAWSITPLADQPIFSKVSAPQNLVLALSVEFPTAISVAHPDRDYSPDVDYIGYFDINKCYSYKFDAVDSRASYFVPAGVARSSPFKHSCTGLWSGNFLNWATMQTIDPFRQALTGGYRVIDTPTLTVLEKAWSGNQGGDANFPISAVKDGAIIASSTPFPASTKRIDISTRTRGNQLHFIVDGTPPPKKDVVDFTSTPAAIFSYEGVAMVPAAGRQYSAFARVEVCNLARAVGGPEENCVAYGLTGSKPEGLMQKYSDQLRYSVFGYLNDSRLNRDGGVLRASQRFIGPTAPVLGSTPVGNPLAEWDPATGVMKSDPGSTRTEASADAKETSTAFGIPISNSGVMNYLNKFGSINPGSYKTYDPVGELYYSATRYLKNQGNVPEYTDMAGSSPAQKATLADGFPVLTRWDDPVLYRCQQNIILGIGDVNTHADRNLPGATGGSEPAKPALVASDTTNVMEYTRRVGVMSGLSGLESMQGYNGCCNNNGALMAGLAYSSNVKDIRPDLPDDLGAQTIQTYWLDVLEYAAYKRNNQYYLATKYGGFKVPDGFDDTRTADLPDAWWTSGDLVYSQKRPRNYFTAARADQMAAGLNSAFKNILGQKKAFTTKLSTAFPQISSTDAASYSSDYSAETWTSEVSGNALSFEASGLPKIEPRWKFDEKLQTQVSSASIEKARRIVTYRDDTRMGAPFSLTNLSAAQRAALDTAYNDDNDAGDFLNYIRGEKANEEGVTTKEKPIYRGRTTLVSDIVGFKLLTVGRPAAPLSEFKNPGYDAFRTKYASRPTMLYAGTNGGMVHAINGSLTGTSAGQEVFAYIPNAVFGGPSGTPTINGLQALGNPSFTHFNRVDGKARVADVDFGRTKGGSGSDWRTILVGGLGKGGKTIYALDITDPTNSVTGTALDEESAAKKVLWEFSHPNLGHVFAEPRVFKTARYGWVVAVGSGYNNSDGKGYFFLINPRNGELLQLIETDDSGSRASDAGLAAVSALVNDFSDGIADALYGGDLLGNLWRVDLTSTTSDYPAAQKLAELRDAANKPLPVTTSPAVLEEPGTQRRWVTVGTGRLLAESDIANPQSNRFFAIWDGFNTRFNRAADLPTAITFPLQTTNFLEITNLAIENKVNFKTNVGWFIDLGKTGSGPGWRVIGTPDVFFGRVAFSAVAPVATDPCAPSGVSRIYAVRVGSGQSTLAPAGTNYVPISSLIPEPLTVSSTECKAGGSDCTTKKKTWAQGSDGNITEIKELDGGSPGVTRINWREIKGTSGQ